MNIPTILNTIAATIAANGGKSYLVGGAVRDSIMGIEPKDFDVEVFGLTMSKLEEVLSQFGKVKEVGKAFGILKLNTEEGEFDFSLPRRENKIGIGHKDFEVLVDPDMTIEEAASRRDFTINSVSYSLDENRMIDPFDGVEHIKKGILHPTSEKFEEDPLRVLRGMQFAGRFKFDATHETIMRCSDIVNEHSTLPVERIWEEWKKWAEKSTVPSNGLLFLFETDWIKNYPELQDMIGLKQEPDFHPEGDVWAHTCLTVDAAHAICVREGLKGDDRIEVILGALCHDMGKKTTTIIDENGKISSANHPKEGVEPATNFLKRIGCPKEMIEKITDHVREHMVHLADDISESGVRRLALRMKTTITKLVHVIEADHSGRHPLPKGNPALRLLEMSKKIYLDMAKPKPILSGKHLMSLGVKPGPQMGVIQKAAFEAQLNGEFNDENGAVTWTENYLKGK